MKKQITFKKMALLVIVLFWGIISNLSAATITVSSAAVSAGVNYNTIQSAYDYIKNSGAITQPYVIELTSTYDPTSGTTLETFPITLNAINGASSTNSITIRPATTVSKTLTSTVSPTNYTYTTTAASTITKIKVADVTNFAGLKIAGAGITNGTTFTVDAINKILTLSAPATNTMVVGSLLSVGNNANSYSNTNDTNTSGLSTFTFASAIDASIAIGDYVTGNAGFAANTTIATISADRLTITINTPATARITANNRITFGTYPAVPTVVTNSVTLSSVANLTADMTISGAGVYGTIETVDAGTNKITYTGGTQAIAAATNLTFGNSGTVFAFDGAKYVTIDGQSGGTGGAKNLTIVNKSTVANASTIYMANDAFKNTVKYCNVLGAASSLSSVPVSGTIVIGGTSGTTAQSGSDPNIVGSGNLYNTIDNCNIGDAHESTLPTIGVFINGNAGYSNRGTAITNCNIYNFFSARPVYSSGIYISANATLSTITGNKLYQTAVRTYTSATEGVNSPIYTSGTNTDSKSISTNIVGFNANNQTGYTKFDGNGNFRFIGIYVGRPLTTAIGNLIANIDIATSSVGVGNIGTVAGIYAANNFPAATVAAPNVIRDIIVRPTASTTGTHTLCGFTASGGSVPTVHYNNIYNLQVIPQSNTVIGKLMGIFVGSSNSHTIKLNNVYNLTCGASGNSAIHNVTGISANTTTTGTNTLERNLIYNLNAISTGASIITGLTASSTTSQNTIKNNMIRLGTDVTSDAIIYGISQNVTSALNLFYYHNTVYIGGQATGAAVNHTFTFYSAGSTTTSSNNTLINNIFANVRTNGSGTTAKHCAIRVGVTGVIKSSNYNLYWTNNITTLGMVGSTLKPTLTDATNPWRAAAYTTNDANSISGDPVFVGATGTTPPDLRITSAASSIVNAVVGASALVTDDFYGSTRTSFTPTDLGAFAFALSYTAPPTVTLASTALATTSTSPIPVTITFSASVTGFDITKLVIANGTAANFAGSGTSYTVNIIPTKDGVVTVDLLPGAGMAGGYGSTAAAQLSRTFDMVPSVVISSTAAETTNYLPVTFTFSEAVTGFIAGDITVSNGTVTNFAGSGTTYTADIIPTAASVVTVDVAASKAIDATSNNNTAATQLTRTCNALPISVVSTAGSSTSATYPALKFAFDAINLGTHQGAIEISVNANSIELASAVLNATGTGTSPNISSYASVKIFPTVSGLTISGDLATPLIDLYGADNVTIDGSVNHNGLAKTLTIVNYGTSTTAGTSTIRMYNDATTNIVKLCTLKGSAQGSAGGVVVIGAGATSGSGNDGITIQNNDFTTANTSAALRPINSVLCSGSSALLSNDNIIVQDNNIYDFLNSTTGTNGVNFNLYSTTVSISGNSFYETTNFVPTSTATYYAIVCNWSGLSGITISDNFIGGSAAQGLGTWTKLNTNSNNFNGIFYNGTTTGTAASIQNNTIRNFNYSNNGAGTFIGFNLAGGKVNIGTTTGNTIGSASGNGSITYTSVNGNFYGINISNTAVGAIDCQNNTIASITSAAATTDYSNIRCIVADRVSETLTISNNIIGSSTTNSIYASSTSTGQTQQVYGINLASGTTVIVSGNTINNMTNNVNSANGSSSQIIGIASGVAGTQTISGNTISNIKINNPSASTAQTICGIKVVNSATVGNNITDNTIFGISSTSASFAKAIYGLYYSGNFTGTNKVSGNKIYGLSVEATNTTASLYGICIATGTTSYANNVINLSGDIQSTLYGIYETGAASNNNSLYHNSVYIGGTPAAGNLNSYALYSNAATNARDFQNNIFVNARANNTATGKHYAAYFGYALSTNLTLNNNLYYAPNAGGMLSYYDGVDVASLTGLPINTGNVNADPHFVGATASTPNMTIDAAYAMADAKGVDVSVADDKDGTARSGLTPTDLGAYAYTSTATKPGVSITPSAIINAAFTATFTFSSAVTGFTLSDIVVGNGSAGSFATVSSSVYTATITPTASAVTVDVAAAVAFDATTYANNTVATQLSRTFYTIAASAGSGGGVSSTGGTYDAGYSLTLDATANSGYHFVNWTVGASEVSTSASYNFSVDENKTLVANFAPDAVIVSNTSSESTSNLIVGAPVTVQSGGQLISNSTDKTLGNVSIEDGGKLTVTNTMTVNDLTLKAGLTTTFSAKIDNPITVTGTFKFLKTMNDARWYFMSFPCEIAVADIKYEDGSVIPAGDLFIKWYDGGHRSDGYLVNNWLTETTTLTANKGYIFGLNTGLALKTLSFPLNTSILSAAPATGLIPVLANIGTGGGNHHGWNLVGQPFLSKFNGSGASVNYIVKTKDGIDGYNALANGSTSIDPFEAYFVQVGVTSNITFDKTKRQSLPASVENNLSDRIALSMTTNTGSDITNLIIDNNQSTTYQIGEDLEKWISTGTTDPQLYTSLNGINYAFNALPYNAVQDLPLAIYTKDACKNTIIHADATQAKGLSTLILKDKVTGASIDLLVSDYTFDASAGTNSTRFTISAQRIINSSSIENQAGGPNVSFINGKLVVSNLKEATSVRVYDMMGRMIQSLQSGSNVMEIKVGVSGMYTVQLESASGQWVKKIVR